MARKCFVIAEHTRKGKKVAQHVRCYEVKKKTMKKGVLSDELDDLVSRARASGPEIDGLGKEYAENYKGTVTPINYKSRKRIAEKAILEEGGDLSAIKDSVRNTVVVSKEQYDAVIKQIQSDSRFDRVKVQDGPNFFGYKGVVTNVKTKNGLLGEVQFNIPSMIYAKEKKSDAMFLIGEERYNEIFRLTGVEGGKGHEYYEKIRTIPDGPLKESLKKKSEDYYRIFRDI